MRGVRPQVQPDIPPEGSPPDSQRRKRRHIVAFVAARRSCLATPLLRLRQKVLLGNASPQPHPDSASQRPILIWDQTVRRRAQQDVFFCYRRFHRPQEVTAKLTSNQSGLLSLVPRSGIPGSERSSSATGNGNENVRTKTFCQSFFSNFDVCFFKYLKFLKVFSNFFIS